MKTPNMKKIKLQLTQIEFLYFCSQIELFKLKQRIDVDWRTKRGWIISTLFPYSLVSVSSIFIYLIMVITWDGFNG